MAVNFKPSFYMATIVFSAVVLAAILLLVTVLATSKAWAPTIRVFTLVFGVLGLVVIALSFARILKLEADHVAHTGANDKSYRLLQCPDGYVVDGAKCIQPNTALRLTCDDVIAGPTRAGRVMMYAPPSLALGDENEPASLKTARGSTDVAEFKKNVCAGTVLSSLPWTSLKALCSDSKSV